MDELEAGYRLDVRVAEKVMGWRQCKVPQHGGDCSYWWETEGLCHVGHTLPSFSTDIAAAWQVVEKLRDKLSVGLWHAPSVSSVMWGWYAAFKESVYPPERHDADTFAAMAETPSLAICLAALKAVGAT